MRPDKDRQSVSSVASERKDDSKFSVNFVVGLRYLRRGKCGAENPGDFVVGPETRDYG